MSRFVDLVMLLSGIMLIVTAQFVVGAALEPMKDSVLDSGINDEYAGDAEADMEAMFVSTVKWVPTIAGFGLITLVAFREFRRQRIIAARGGI